MYHGMKTYSKERIELQNLQILKKMQEKSGPFLSLEQHWELRKLVVAIWFDFLYERAFAMVKICVYSWWFSNQFDIVSETPYSCNAVEMDRNIHIGKQSYMFILTNF